MDSYSKNPIIDGFEHIGHWLHVAEHTAAEEPIHIIHEGLVVAKDFKTQFPTLASEAGAVAVDLLQCKALGAAIAMAVISGGTNLAADAGILAALVTDRQPLIQAFSDAGKLAETIGQDVKADL